MVKKILKRGEKFIGDNGEKNFETTKVWQNLQTKGRGSFGVSFCFFAL